jgi:fructose 1,6-bisphosphatase
MKTTLSIIKAEPVPHGTGCSYFDGPPIVSCFGFCVKTGRLTEPVDLFAHPFWDTVRARAAEKAMEIRRQGLSGPTMLSYGRVGVRRYRPHPGEAGETLRHPTHGPDS